MPVVNPGIRRLLASAIQRLFNGASFSAPLTHSAIPTRAASGTTATFTRATTATVRDNEGVLRTAIAGEARFEGARRVRNLVNTTSEDFSNAAWTKTLATVTAGFDDPDGGTGAYRLQSTGASGYIEQIIATTKLPIANSALMSWYIKSNTGASQTVKFGRNASIESKTVTTSWQRLTHFTASSAGSNFYLQDNGGNNLDVLIYKCQIEDITGRADQTTPSEYVSVGVLSAPYYHGSFVDGVKCFPTDLSGNPIPSTTLLGYLAEGARTNLIVRSNELDNASWTKNNATISANGAVASDGTTSLDKIVEAAATSIHSVYQTIAGTSGSYTVSVEMKQAERTWGFITEGNSVTATAYFNLAAGTVGTVSGTGSPSATITALANGAYRCTMTFTAGANANCQFGPATGNGSASYAGDITKGIYAGMVGFENNAFASSYIATTTDAVARDADVEAVSTSGNIAAAAGSVYLEYTPTHTPSGTIALWGTYVDASNYTAILHDATNMIMRKRIAGVNYDATIGNAFTTNTTYKVCGSWGAAGVTVTLDGTEGTASANTTAAQIAATMQVGADGNNLQQPFAALRNVRVWQRQISEEERGSITGPLDVAYLLSSPIDSAVVIAAGAPAYSIGAMEIDSVAAGNGSVEIISEWRLS